MIKHITKHLIVAVSLILFAGTYTPTMGDEAKPFVSPLASKLSTIDAPFDDYLSEGKIAGYTTLISQNGKIIHFNAAGKRSIQADDAMQKDTIFRIYSMTKPITGVALMMLHEEGKFKLDDPLHKFIPAFKDTRVFDKVIEGEVMLTKPLDRPITIRDILTHTSGMTYGVFGDHAVDKAYRSVDILTSDQNTRAFADKVAALPLMFQPGERWHYSVSVDVQGALVEELSGQPFDVFLKERIFKPLGMADTGFYVPKDKLDRFVDVYSINEDKELFSVADQIQDFTIEPTFKSGGGGLVSTTIDYWRFSQMMLNGGELDGVRILKPETVALMTRNHIPQELSDARGQPNTGFGLGYAVMQHMGENNWKGNDGEYNWGGMANTVFWIDPKEQLIAIFMTNMLPSHIFPFREDLQKGIYPLGAN